VLAGRNIASLNEHWREMSRSLKERNVSLFRDVRARARLRAAQAAGALAPEEAARAAAAVNTDSPPVLYGPNETLAYVLHQLLPQYGVAHRILSELRNAVPPPAAGPGGPAAGGYRPVSMLDFGSGPGSAVFAARTVWPESLFDVVVVEPSRSMMQVAEHLLADLPGGAMFRRSLAEVQRLHRGKRFDLIVCSATLGQLPTERERDAALAELWDLLAPGGALVLSEHSDRWGFEVVRRSRELLLNRATALARFMPQLASDRLLPPPTAGGISSGAAAATRQLGGETDEGDNDDFGDAASVAAAEREYSAQSRTRGGSGQAPAVDLRGLDDADFGLPLDSHRGGTAPPLAPGATALARAAGAPDARDLESRLRQLPSVAAAKDALRAYAARNGLALSNEILLRPPADALGMAVVGPCAHALACPMAGSTSWCHFSQAVARHRKAGRSVHTRGLPRRWESFSYVTLRKTEEGLSALEHPPHQRAGWTGSGAFSLRSNSAAGSNGGRSGGEDESESGGEEAGGNSRQAPAAAAPIVRAGLTGGALALASGAGTRGVLTLARRNLEPEAWWLEQRPGRLRSDLGEEARGHEEGPAHAPPKLPERAPLGVAAVMRALAAAAPATGRGAYAKAAPAGRSGRAAAFGASGGDGAVGFAGNSVRGVDAAEAGFARGLSEDLGAERVLERAVRAAVSSGLPGAGQWARLVRAPLKRNAHVILDVCTPQGSFERRVASKGKLKDAPGAYRSARKSRWGALWPNWLARLRGDGAMAAAAALPLLEHNAAAATLLEAPAPALASDRIGGSGAGAVSDVMQPKRSSRKARRRRAMAAALDNFASEEDRAKAAFSVERGASIGSVQGAAALGDRRPEGARRMDASALLRRK
jgi:ribosomal protein RSM22 (predicted rRNA methylase)